MSEEKIHIEKNTVQETLVIPLFGRKLCTELYSDFFTDKKAVELMDRLDYDFGDIEKRSKNIVERYGALEVASRQKAFAVQVREYLKTHPNASIVNLGCGLDQTAEDCDNGTCKIYNVDFPDIIDIRNKMIPPSERVTNIACDINDTSWFEKVEREEGSVFFASGVFYYFTREQMEKLINSMAEYFNGGKLTFDIAGKFAVKMAVKTWVEKSGIEGVDTSFYVGSLDKDLKPWIKNAKASSKGYMTGYFDLKKYNISFLFRLISQIADKVMKMKIVTIDFN